MSARSFALGALRASPWFALGTVKLAALAFACLIVFVGGFSILSITAICVLEAFGVPAARIFGFAP